jgi:hypothetical protein
MLNKYLVMDYMKNEIEEVSQITIKALKRNKEEFFKLSPNSNTVYIVNHYDRTSKSYSISPFEDCNKEKFIKSSRKIYIGFTY